MERYADVLLGLIYMALWDSNWYEILDVYFYVTIKNAIWLRSNCRWFGMLSPLCCATLKYHNYMAGSFLDHTDGTGSNLCRLNDAFKYLRAEITWEKHWNTFVVSTAIIIWTIDDMLSIPSGTHFNEILFVIQKFSFKEMHLKISSAKWRPFCRGLNVHTVDPNMSMSPCCQMCCQQVNIFEQFVTYLTMTHTSSDNRPYPRILRADLVTFMPRISNFLALKPCRHIITEKYTEYTLVCLQLPTSQWYFPLGTSMGISYWTRWYGTHLFWVSIILLSYYIPARRFRLCDWLSLRCLVSCIDHSPPVCQSSIRHISSV